MSNKLGIKLSYTPTYSPQTNGLIERQNSTIKTSLKAALIQMGEEHKENWYNFLPWILLMKRTAYQADLKASPAMLTYGSNLTIPGDLLRQPSDLSGPDLENLANFMQKVNNKPPIQTSTKPQTLVEPPPLSVKHVYTKQHQTTGLQAHYEGPFLVAEQVSRSVMKLEGGSYQDEVCVEQASAGVEVNTKVRHAIILQSVYECGVSR